LGEATASQLVIVGLGLSTRAISLLLAIQRQPNCQPAR